ncbi:MAG: glycosyltransferase family 4 protein [Acidimicrobiales bacterium]
MASVDIVVPELADRDATGAHSLMLARLLGERGVDVRLVVQRADPRLDERASLRVTSLRRWRRPADVVVLQHAIGSLAAQAVIDRRLPVVVNYHNITPWEFLEPWESELVGGLRWGREQLEHLARRAVLGLADSAYNGAELERIGFRDVRVTPILFDRARWEASAPPAVVDRLRRRVGAGPVWLFVGRLAPNKAQHDLVAAFAAFAASASSSGHAAHDARLMLVGGASSPRYARAVEELAGRLGVGDSVVFAGSVGDDELAACYELADVFVCLSDHEGFCVPLLEAMAREVPIVAYDAAAVSETLAWAGLVLSDKAPLTVAGAVGRVLDDPALAAGLSARGRRRLDDFDLRRTSGLLMDALSPLLDRR